MDKRFSFGNNWRKFLSLVDSQRVKEAENSLKEMLGVAGLGGRSFLDVGCGSGLFSLAARRLGARVHSFDYDPLCVDCTTELKQRFLPGDAGWTIESGSVLDPDYVASLGTFDIVYSWGVLHHTGDMWNAINNVLLPVNRAGFLFIAIYNDQGLKSRIWHEIKRFYCSGRLAGAVTLAVFIPYLAASSLVHDIIAGRNPAERYKSYGKNRGMSVVRDWIDWLGGYPYEVAKPGEVRAFIELRGFQLIRLQATSGPGNNQFVFKRIDGRAGTGGGGQIDPSGPDFSDGEAKGR